MSKITVLLGQKDHRKFDLSEHKILLVKPETEEITVKSKEVVQEIYPSENKLIRKVIVDSVALDKPDQTKTTIPTKERQVVKADAGYELAENIVEAIPDEFADITGVTATAEDVLNGKTFVDSTGTTIQGTAELKEDLDRELTEQENEIARLEISVEKLPEPKPSGGANIEATLLEDGSYSLTILEA